jgi:prevent-host-death family protein
MTQSLFKPTEHPASALLQVADYLSRPQQFVAVAEARAAFRRTLERVNQASVVLTSNGEPAVALVPFATLEAMRSALLHLLVGEIEASFAQGQAQVARKPDVEPTSEEELEALVDDAVRRARHQSASSSSPNA